MEQKEAEGAAVRARVNNKFNWEKPTKFFCALEKYNNLQKYIPSLKITDGEGNEKTITDQ